MRRVRTTGDGSRHEQHGAAERRRDPERASRDEVTVVALRVVDRYVTDLRTGSTVVVHDDDDDDDDDSSVR